MKPRLYSFWRSSAAFRVRIALHLKGIDYETVATHLTKKGGDQLQPEYGAKNPNRLIPLYEDGDVRIHQSLAIIDYLDEIYPEPPLLPSTAADRAWVRALALDIAADIHPINNLRVSRYLVRQLEVSEEARSAWYRHWVATGLAGLEAQISKDPRSGRFCYGDQVTLADICLVPQLFNALDAKMDVALYPRLMGIFQECMKLPAFINASWEKQIDAEGANPAF
jgi:maleylacetoacetate isomerase/maleylpyruvate isomerase